MAEDDAKDKSSGSASVHDKVMLTFNAKSRKLEAHVAASHSPSSLTHTDLKDLIANSAYPKLYLLSQNFDQVIAASKHNQALVIDVAEIRDAELEIIVANDRMSAAVSLTSAYGGKEFAEADIRHRLNERGIIGGVLDDKIAEVIADSNGAEITIAQGEPPQHGSNGNLEALVESRLFKGPKEDDSGKMDFFNIQEFVLVEAGTPLMRYHPAGEGIAGFDVYQQPIPASFGTDEPLQLGEGVCPSEEDEHVIVAERRGHPVILPNGVRVDSTLVLERIDLSTGNVHFDGAVHIKGDIADNMTVLASDDITVDGVIQKAYVKSGGDIVVRNGIIGGPLSYSDFGVEEYSARLSADGSIKARFVDNAELQAGNEVNVREYIRHSHIMARQLFLGQEGNGKGQLIGGKTSVLASVEAKVIGTQADVHTYVEVGVAPEIRAEYDLLSEMIADKNNTMTSLIASFVYLKKKFDGSTDDDGESLDATPSDKKDLVKTAASIKSTLAELEELNQERDELEFKIHGPDAPFIEIQHAAYRNLLVKIKDAEYRVNETIGSGKFELQGREVIFSG